MDAADMAQISQWLQQHGITDCPLCGGTPLQVKPELGALVSLADAAATPGPPRAVHALVTVKCLTCGHIMNFEAADVGIQP